MGVPPTEQVEQLQKGTIDGVFIDYGGAGIAFKMGGILKYSTEMYSYVSSFGLAMNEEFWRRLPPDLQALVTKSVTGVEKEIGQAWDGLDVPGKKALLDGGAEAIRLPARGAREVPQDRRGGHRGQAQGAGGQGPAGARRLRHDEGPRREAREDSKSFWV